jgi:hypothetical protein
MVRVHGKLHVVVGFGDIRGRLSSIAGSNFFLGGFRGMQGLVELAVMFAMSSSCHGAANARTVLIQQDFMVLNGCLDMSNCRGHMLTCITTFLSDNSAMCVFEFVSGFVEVVNMAGFGCIGIICRE